MDESAACLTEEQFREHLRTLEERYKEEGALVNGAVVCRRILGLFELFIAHLMAEELSLRESSRRSGYHPDHLSRLVRQGKIPDLRPKGSRGPIRIRATDLPHKPGYRINRSRVAQIAQLTNDAEREVQNGPRRGGQARRRR